MSIVPLGKRSSAIPTQEIHKYDDVDIGADSHHHTIGEGPNQAASGQKLKDLSLYVASLPPPSGGGANFVMEQLFVAGSTVWTIVHNKGTKGISVYTTNSFGIEIEGDHTYPDLNTVQVTFYHPQTGTARVYY